MKTLGKPIPTTYRVTLAELLEFIKAEYHLRKIECSPYRLRTLQDFNGYVETIPVERISMMSIYNYERLSDFKQTGKADYMIYVILQDMVNREVIPPAIYQIDTDPKHQKE